MIFEILPPYTKVVLPLNDIIWQRCSHCWVRHHFVFGGPGIVCSTAKTLDFSVSAYHQSIEESPLFRSHALFVDTFFTWIVFFTSSFHQGVTFLPLFATPNRFCPHARAADETTDAWTAATPLPLCIPCAFRTRSLVCKDLTYNFSRQGLSLSSIEFPGPACLRRPWWLFQCKLQNTRWW